MPDSFEDRCRQLIAQRDPRMVLVLPRPLSEIMRTVREGDPAVEDAKLVHRFYEELAADSRVAWR